MRGLGNPAGTKGFKYKDPQQLDGPCKLALIKPGKLVKVVCKGAQMAFTLDGAPQGSMAVALDVGALRYCMSFAGAEVLVDVPAAGGVGKFKAAGATSGSPCPVP